MTRRSTFSAGILAFGVLAVAATGCSSIDPVEARANAAKEQRAAPAETFDPSRVRTATHEEIERLGLRQGEYALRVDRTLLYPCQWLRAEDLAVTLEPLIQTHYGSNAVVIPHAETNYLFIYIPPPHLRDSPRRQATPTRPTSRSTTQGPSPTSGRSTTPNATTRR